MATRAHSRHASKRQDEKKKREKRKERKKEGFETKDCKSFY